MNLTNLKEFTLADAGIGATGSTESDADTYATGDNRIPSIVGKTQKRFGKPLNTKKKRKKRGKKSKVNEKFVEQTSIFDYLVWQPEGDLEKIARKLDKNKSKEKFLYRGISRPELRALSRDKKVISRGKGNTNERIMGSYVSDIFHLAARFALVNYRDSGNGYVLLLKRDALPDLETRDPGNYVTSYIPIEAVADIIDLRELAAK